MKEVNESQRIFNLMNQSTLVQIPTTPLFVIASLLTVATSLSRLVTSNSAKIRLCCSLTLVNKQPMHQLIITHPFLFCLLGSNAWTLNLTVLGLDYFFSFLLLFRSCLSNQSATILLPSTICALTGRQQRKQNKKKSCPRFDFASSTYMFLRSSGVKSEGG